MATKRCWYWTESQPAWSKCSDGGFHFAEVKMPTGEWLTVCLEHHNQVLAELKMMGYPQECRAS